MAFTQAQLDAIETAIASGELTVSFDNRTVTYRSMSDLLKARNTIRASLQESGITAAVPRVSYASISRT